MADKAPKFARTQLSDLSDLSVLPGAWHLLAGRFQPGLPALIGGSVRFLAPVGAGWHGLLALIGRSVWCLAPVGASCARDASTVWRQVATARTGGYRPDRRLPPGLQLTHSVRIANLDA